MPGWFEFIAAFILFMLAHIVPVRWKAQLTRTLGRAGYIAAFSVLSLGLLWWLLMAAGRAPYVQLWPQHQWQRWLVNLAMPVAIVLAVFEVGAPNPFSFAGRKTGFDPARPGIVGLTRYPLMWAFAIWAGAHLVANGDLAHVVLFGLMKAFALSGIRAADARARRNLPDFDALAAHSSAIPGGALLSGVWRPQKPPGLARLVIALLVWAGLLWLHPMVIGVSPLP